MNKISERSFYSDSSIEHIYHNHVIGSELVCRLVIVLTLFSFCLRYSLLTNTCAHIYEKLVYIHIHIHIHIHIRSFVNFTMDTSVWNIIMNFLHIWRIHFNTFLDFFPQSLEIFFFLTAGSLDLASADTFSTLRVFIFFYHWLIRMFKDHWALL